MTSSGSREGVQHTKHRPELLRINAQSSILWAVTHWDSGHRSAPGSAPGCPRIGFSQLWSGLAARAGYSSLAQLLAQALNRLGLAAHAQERALGIGALLQHRAGGEDLPAQFLRRPGKEELGLDEVPLEERDDRLVQPGDVALLLRAHHDAAGVLCAQRGLVPAAVDLVEDEEARHVFRADLGQHKIDRGGDEAALRAK